MEDRIGDPELFALLLQTLMDESPVYKNPTLLEPKIKVARQTITRWINQEAQIHPFRARAILREMCDAFGLDTPIPNDEQRERVRVARRKGLYHFAGYPLPEEPGQTSAELKAIMKPDTQTPDQGSGRLRRPARLQRLQDVPRTDELGPVPERVRRQLEQMKRREHAYVEAD